MAECRKIRVLHVVCDLHGGGAERLVLDLCRSAPDDVEASVASVHGGGELSTAFEAARIPVFYAGRDRGRLGLRATQRLATWMRNVDVVHTHLWAGDTWGRLAAVFARHPCVVSTEHNVEPDSPWRGRVSSLLSGVTQRVVCVSDAVAESAVAQGVSPERVVVIPNGIDLERFQPGSIRPGKSGRVLGIGRLTPQKGFDVLADAADAQPGLEVGVVGTGEQHDLLSRRRLTLHGWQDNLSDFLAWADMVAIPSRWEGFGLVAVEAMASGVPVVASEISPLTEVLGPAAVWVPPGDAVALGEALIGLADNPARRAALAAMGVERAKQFAIDETVAAYARLYKSLLNPA